MFRIITIEREYGSGGGAIAKKLSERLGWKLWDRSLTEEIASLANVDCSEVERHGERLDSRLYRLGKVFWRGSYERAIPLDDSKTFDADCMVSMMERITAKIAKEGNAVVVGRGAPYFLRERGDTFHVFLYAPRGEKIRRLLANGNSEAEAEDLVDTVDRDRIAFVKHYFGADWPTRWLYHLMINTAVGRRECSRHRSRHDASAGKGDGRETVGHSRRAVSPAPCIGCTESCARLRSRTLTVVPAASSATVGLVHRLTKLRHT